MSVYPNARGKWAIDIDDFYHPDGRKEPRIRRTSPVNTERGAERYERQIRQALQDGTYGQKARGETPTVAGFRESYMDVYRGEKRKASGIRDKVCLLDRHIIPLFGDKRLDSFKLVDQHKLRARFAKLSNSRYNGAAAVLNRMIELYYKTEEIRGEPFRFELLPVVDKKRPFYTFEQYAALLASASRHSSTAEVACLLGGDAGLRRSEMFALTRDHCDMVNRVLTIEEAEVVVKLDGITDRHRDDTKGLKIRYVDMTSRLHAALERHLAANRRSKRVLLDTSGNPFTPESFRDHLMAPVQKAADLSSEGNVHILRHTFCSHLAIRGVPVLTIKELAGHSRIETTLKYMHLAPGEKRRAIDRLEEPAPGESRQRYGNGGGHAHNLA